MAERKSFTVPPPPFPPACAQDKDRVSTARERLLLGFPSLPLSLPPRRWRRNLAESHVTRNLLDSPVDFKHFWKSNLAKREGSGGSANVHEARGKREEWGSPGEGKRRK